MLQALHPFSASLCSWAHRAREAYPDSWEVHVVLVCHLSSDQKRVGYEIIGLEGTEGFAGTPKRARTRNVSVCTNDVQA